jgi:hypothetical protein
MRAVVAAHGACRASGNGASAAAVVFRNRGNLDNGQHKRGLSFRLRWTRVEAMLGAIHPLE